MALPFMADSVCPLDGIIVSVLVIVRKECPLSIVSKGFWRMSNL